MMHVIYIILNQSTFRQLFHAHLQMLHRFLFVFETFIHHP